MRMVKLSAIQRACDLVGGQSRLAREVARISGDRITPQAVQQWVQAGVVPAKRVLAVESATCGQVLRHELRPDLYPEQTEPTT